MHLTGTVWGQGGQTRESTGLPVYEALGRALYSGGREQIRVAWGSGEAGIGTAELLGVALFCIMTGVLGPKDTISKFEQSDCALKVCALAGLQITSTLSSRQAE